VAQQRWLGYYECSHTWLNATRNGILCTITFDWGSTFRPQVAPADLAGWKLVLVLMMLLRDLLIEEGMQ
jgi:hypothetical protein